MQIIPQVYLSILPLIWIIALVSNPAKKYCIDVLSTVNLMVWIYAIYSIKILIGTIQLLRSLNSSVAVTPPEHLLSNEFLLQQLSKVFLPFFLLIPQCRQSFLFSVLVWANLWWSTFMPLFDWQYVFLSIPYCFSLFCATYALLWLFKQQPSQKAYHNV